MKGEVQAKNLFVAKQDDDWQIFKSSDTTQILQNKTNVALCQLFLPRSVEEQIEFGEQFLSDAQIERIASKINNLSAKNLCVAKVQAQINGKKRFVPMIFELYKKNGVQKMRLPYFEKIKNKPFVFESKDYAMLSSFFDLADKKISPLQMRELMQKVSTSTFSQKFDKFVADKKERMMAEQHFDFWKL